MKRPTVTDEMKLEAAKQVAENLNDADPQTIADHWRSYMDGYALARELDRYCGWDFTMQEVEELDSMGSIVDGLLREAEKKWAEETKPEPPLPIGAATTKGEITGISNYSAAAYEVKPFGQVDEECGNRRLIIRFEDAVAA